MSATTSPQPSEFPAPQLVSLQAVFRFAAIGRGDPALDGTVHDLVREYFPLRLLQRPEIDPGPQAPHLVFSSQTAQMAVGSVQADVIMQLAGNHSSGLTDLVQGALKSSLDALVAGGFAVTTVGLITTMQTSTLGAEGVSPQMSILSNHLSISDVAPEDVQDASVALNVKVADRYYVGLNLSSYESRQISQPVMPGMVAVPMVMNPWDGILTDEGLQLRVDANNQLRHRVGPSDAEPVNQDELSDILRLTQIVAENLAQGFMSHASLPISPLEGALNDDS